MKFCSCCGIEKPFSEYYYEKRTSKYRAECKDCAKKRVKETTDREKKKIREKLRYESNREEFIRYSTEYKRLNRDKDRLWSREYYQRNKDKTKERVKRLQWAKNNPDKAIAISHAYRARKRFNGGVYTIEEWNDIKEKYGNRCLRCGKTEPLTVDHVIPISLGGKNDISNIQPLCKSCNSSKGANTVDYRESNVQAR